MSPLKATTLWLLYSLRALALAHPDSNDTKLKTLTLPDNNNLGSKILNRRASDDEFCTDGGCAACFGSGYQDCPNSSLYCYLPGDSLVGIESCYASSGSDSTDTSTTPSSTDSSVPTTDTCENGGLSCAYCFGEGNIACPQSDGYCYDPSNSTSICPEGVGSESGSSSGSASSETDSAAASGTSSPTTDDTESSVTPASGAGSTDTAGGIAGGSGDAEDQSSATSTRSGSSSSATSGSTSGQGSSAGNGNGNSNSNGSPVQNSNGHSVVREGLVGVLAAGGAAFVAAIHLRI